MTDWYLGAYGADMNGGAAGIRRLVSQHDGTLVLDDFLIEAPSPSFLAQHGETLYATLEGAGAIGVYGATSSMVSSGGQWPCHVARYGDVVVVANYFEGNIGVIVGDALVEVLPSEGSGPHPAQGGAHAHASAEIAPGVVVTADLGADRLYVHDVSDAGLTRTATVVLPAGASPRDLLRHPSGLLYVLSEHDRSVLVLRDLEVVATVPLPGALPTDQSAALALGDGFLYAGLRGSNQVSVLAVDGDGMLHPLGSVPTAGDWPRHLVVDGDLLHVANQLSNSVASFRLGADGLPVLIGVTEVASPTYLLRAP